MFPKTAQPYSSDGAKRLHWKLQAALVKLPIS